jgi:hypothetical protein
MPSIFSHLNDKYIALNTVPELLDNEPLKERIVNAYIAQECEYDINWLIQRWNNLQAKKAKLAPQS